MPLTLLPGGHLKSAREPGYGWRSGLFSLPPRVCPIHTCSGGGGGDDESLLSLRNRADEARAAVAGVSLSLSVSADISMASKIAFESEQV